MFSLEERDRRLPPPKLQHMTVFDRISIIRFICTPKRFWRRMDEK